MPVGAMLYVNKNVDEVKGDVIYARRKARNIPSCIAALQANMLRVEEPLPMAEELMLSPAAPQDPPSRASSLTSVAAEAVAMHMPTPQRRRQAGKCGIGKLCGRRSGGREGGRGASM
ncbi:hypothetical protein TRAPUB_3324 [Trametes pubescens]|uniref:Uncharacterized protein n=1 Tax=Trametes pubescens TaxID=154538 RepID=A0A1M2VDY8_TRAPU|nr:hypothetical protein TRAPUB_3324 [Trametes pubescens]